MTFDFLAMKTTSTMERKAEKERLKEEERATAQAIEQVMPSLLVFFLILFACLCFHLMLLQVASLRLMVSVCVIGLIFN